MSVTYPTKVLLAFRSGNRCAFPGCDRPLSVDSESGADPVITGVAAHIAGEHRGAARYDDSMTDAQRNRYDNLIYLCGDHHTQVDGQESEFTVEKLLQMKAEHEARVCEAVQAAFADVAFPELQQATRWVLQLQPGQPGTDYTVTSPDEKIRKNDLSEKTRATIAMGLSVAGQVKAFVQSEAQVDPDFPERLKAGFLEEYFRLRRNGLRGDDLFDNMCQFAQRGMRTQASRSAGLAVLIYLFEVCEVFEK